MTRFYFKGHTTTPKGSDKVIVNLKTTPKADKSPCKAGETYRLAIPKALEDSLEFKLEDGKWYVGEADEWWLDGRDGVFDSSHLLHGKNLTIREWVDNTQKREEEVTSNED